MRVLEFSLCLLIASLPSLGLTVLLIALLIFVVLCFPSAMVVITPWAQVSLVALLMYLLPREIARIRTYSLQIWDRLFSNSASTQALPGTTKISHLEEKQLEPSVSSIDERDWRADLITAAKERASSREREFSKEKQAEPPVRSIKRDWRRDLIVAKRAS